MDSRFAKAQRILIIALVFFVVLAIFPLTADATVDIKVLGYELGAFVALALWLFSPRSENGVTQRSSALFPLLAVFMALNLAAGFFSPNTGYSLFREFVKLAALFILFVAAADVFRTPRHVWFLAGAICIAVSIASVYGLIQFKGLDPFPWGDAHGMLREAPATFGNPNVASHALAPAIILAFALCTQRKYRWAILCAMLFLCHFALTQTRGSLLALACATLFVPVALLAFRKARETSRVFALALGSLLSIGLIGVVALAVFLTMKTGQAFPDDEPLTLRANSFQEACRMIQDRPLLGYGPGMYEVVSPEYWTSLDKQRFITENMMNAQVHNEPLQFAVEAGLAAGIVYLAILVLGIYYGLAMAFASGGSGKRPLGLALAAFFLAFLVDGLFGFNAHVPVSSLLLFLLAGATAGLWRGEQTPSSRQARPHGWRTLLWRFAVLGCAALIPILGVRDFAAQFWHQRGQGATEFKAYKEAAECFRNAEALAPHHWIHPYFRGVTAMSLNAPDEAATHFVRTLSLNPNYIGAQSRIAEALIKVAARPSQTQEPPELQKAIEYAQRAVQLVPEDPEAYDLLGRASLLRAQLLTRAPQGQPSEAATKAWQESERQFLKAIEYGSKRKDQIYRFVAVTRLARNDVPGGQKALALSLGETPDGMETWQIFLQSSQRTGQYDALRMSLDSCIERLNESKKSSGELGALRVLQAQVLYSGYGDRSGAEAAFVQAVEKHPEDADAWAAFHAFAKAAGRAEAFNASLAQATAKLNTADKDLPPQLRAVALGLGTGEDALISGVASLMNALQEYQTTAQDAAKTAEVFSWTLDVLTARAQQASLSPENAGEVFYRLGLAYGACRDFNAAAQLLDLAAGNLSGPQLQECLLRRGAALVQTGNTAATVQAFEQAVANDATSLEAHFNLAQALAQNGQRDQARQEYQTILSTFEINAEGRKALQQALDALSQ